MEKKSLLIYGGIVVVGIGLMVGLVLFLRARNAPPTLPTAITNTNGTVPTSAVPKKGTVHPYVPIDQAPVAPVWQTGDPDVPITVDRVDLPDVSGSASFAQP
ncbi:MAG: hypothetical protein WA001_01980 [Patescibacteria group bacterium]